MNNKRHFHVHGVLGEGGFGVVYHATLKEGDFQTEVAVKVLKSDDIAPSVLARFRDEAKVLGLIRDRAIIGVYPPALLGDQPALVMEYCEGMSAAALLKHLRAPYPLRVATEVIGEVARSLDAVYHQQGPDGRPLELVHRDIKPGNIQLTSTGTVKLLDFGLARASYGNRESHTTTHLFGTPQYMAPERLEAESTPATDIFSLGCVFRRLATGDKPLGLGRFKSANVAFEPSEVRDEVRAFMDRMIENDPSLRPTARQVERFCKRMSNKMGEEPDLADWSREVVVKGQLAEGALTGKAIIDTFQISANTAPVDKAHSAGLVAGGAAVGLGVALFAAVLLAAGVGAYWYSNQEVAAEAPTRVRVTRREEPTPKKAKKTVDPAPKVVVAAPAPPVVKVTSEPEPAKRAPVEEPKPAKQAQEPVVLEEAPASTEPAQAAPEPAAPAAPLVHIKSSVPVFFLDSSGSRVSRSALTPGTYTIVASFDKMNAEKLTTIKTVQLKEGSTTSITCNAGFSKCVVK